MKEQIKFSIVMPVYNVEKHLYNAVNSVFNQSYSNLEIILVDDCSTDSSKTLVDEFSAKNDKVTAFHNETNLGLSKTRNRGFSHVTGDYVFFMDSDDVVEPTLLSDVAKSLEVNKAEVVVFGMIEDYYDKDNKLSKSYPISYGKELLLDSPNDIHVEVINLEEKTFYGYAWNKIYSVEYLKKCHAEFTTITLIEDIKFNVEVFQNITKLNILNTTPYHYIKRLDGSLTNKFLPNYYELNYRRVELIYNQFQEWNSCNAEVKSILGNILVRYTFSALQRNCDPRSKMSMLKRCAWIKRLYDDALFCELVEYAGTSNKVFSVMVNVLKKKHMITALLIGELIYLVKDKFPMVFARLKHNK